MEGRDVTLSSHPDWLSVSLPSSPLDAGAALCGISHRRRFPRHSACTRARGDQARNPVDIDSHDFMSTNDVHMLLVRSPLPAAAAVTASAECFLFSFSCKSDLTLTLSVLIYKCYKRPEEGWRGPEDHCSMQ
ncbi:hypothetical protein GOODEAATRI_000447 [Goodea atripinnis]|uniref:Uncharacterized protein n=1 Tax=Goodea atripinnis TaxID=208336 RepID=A0ABV0MXK7_9TELE